jgi:K+-transporting ATPase A subunit
MAFRTDSEITINLSRDFHKVILKVLIPIALIGCFTAITCAVISKLHF